MNAEWRRACDAHVAAIERTHRVSGQWRRSVHAEKEKRLASLKSYLSSRGASWH